MPDYGWGLKVNTYGEIQFNKNGKLEIVEDRENLGQQLSLRLRSPKGSHPFDPNFGLDVAGMSQNRKFYPDMEQLIEAGIIQCLIQNRNVSKIEMVRSTRIDRRNWRVEVKVKTNDGVNVFFDTLMQENADTSRYIENEFST